VRLWDAVSGAQLAVMKENLGSVQSVSWSPDGGRVASAGDDGTVRLWDAVSGAQLAVMEGHRDGVQSVSWSPDGGRVASGGDDGTVRLWDASGAVLPLEGALVGGDRCDRLSPDGTRVDARAPDGSLRGFEMRPPRLLATLHASGDHVLTRTPGGYVLVGNGGSERYVVAAPNPRTPSGVLYLPFGPLREFFHRPDKVAAALRGDLSADDPLVDMLAAGWVVDTTWDGGIVRMPDAPPAPEGLPPAALAPSARSPEPLAFELGRAIEHADALAGRQRELAELCALIGRRQPTKLLGPRRGGKTSLLQVLAEQLLGEGRSVSMTSLEGVVLRGRDDLARRLDARLDEHPQPAEAFAARHRVARDHVFLVDELARLAELSPLDLGWFRNMTQNTASFVLAGTPWDWRRVFAQSAQGRHGSPLNNFRTLALGPLDADDAVAFLVERSPPDAPVSTDAARWAVEACDGWPFYLQLIGWELASRSRAGNRAAHISREAMQQMVKDLLPVAAEDAFESRWDELPSVIRQFLLEGTEVSTLSRDRRQILVQTGLFSEGVGMLRDRPFFDWIRLNAARLPLDTEDDA